MMMTMRTKGHKEVVGAVVVVQYKVVLTREIKKITDLVVITSTTTRESLKNKLFTTRQLTSFGKTLIESGMS